MLNRIRTSMEHHPRPELQRLSLDCATAPTLSNPVAPFAKSERQKAHTSAVYYSECFLRGIQPIDADLAACDAESRYKKWWVKACYQDNQNQNNAEEEEDRMDKRVIRSTTNARLEGDHPRKRRKTEYAQKHESVTSTMTAAAAKATTATKRIEKATVATVTTTKLSLNARSDSSSMHVLTDEETSSCAAADSKADKTNIRSDTTGGTVPIIQDLSRFTAATAATTEWKHIFDTKAKLLEHLKSTGGDTSTDVFRGHLDTLHSFYCSRGWDVRCISTRTFDVPPSSLDGKWLDLTKPTFSDCIKEGGECIYTLGRMSFDMFRPANLRCSLTGMYNSIRIIDRNNKQHNRPVLLPRKLARQIEKEGLAPEFRHYDLLVNFTIQENQTRSGTPVDPLLPTTNGKETTTSDDEGYVLRRPLKGSMTNLGYLIPDPNVPNRLTVWFCGGTLSVDRPADLESWKGLFLVDENKRAPPSRNNTASSAEVLATKLLLGAYIPEKMKEDGTMTYMFKRPIGGHGQVFCDVLYMDETLRIMRGHSGSIFVHNRVSSVTE